MKIKYMQGGTFKLQKKGTLGEFKVYMPILALGSVLVAHAFQTVMWARLRYFHQYSITL